VSKLQKLKDKPKTYQNSVSHFHTFYWVAKLTWFS
jgi:hypothetical protein